MIDYEEEASSVSDDELDNIASLAALLRKHHNNIAELEAQLKREKELARRIEEESLPTAMQQLGGVGMDMFRLSDGTTLELKSDLYMSIPKKNMPQVCQWVIDHGQGSLVRTHVALDFGAGELDAARRAEEMLHDAGFDHTQVGTTVNTASLKAVVKELLEQGVDVPLKLMGGHERSYVQVKQGNGEPTIPRRR